MIRLYHDPFHAHRDPYLVHARPFRHDLHAAATLHGRHGWLDPSAVVPSLDLLFRLGRGDI